MKIDRHVGVHGARLLARLAHPVEHRRLRDAGADARVAAHARRAAALEALLEEAVDDLDHRVAGRQQSQVPVRARTAGPRGARVRSRCAPGAGTTCVHGGGRRLPRTARRPSSVTSACQDDRAAEAHAQRRSRARAARARRRRRSTRARRSVIAWPEARPAIVDRRHRRAQAPVAAADADAPPRRRVRRRARGRRSAPCAGSSCATGTSREKRMRSRRSLAACVRSALAICSEGGLGRRPGAGGLRGRRRRGGSASAHAATSASVLTVATAPAAPCRRPDEPPVEPRASSSAAGHRRQDHDHVACRRRAVSRPSSTRTSSSLR